MEESIFLIKNPLNLHTDCYFSYCGFAKTEPRHSFGPAIREQYLIHIILEGEGYYSVKNQKYSLKKGQGFVIPPNISTFYQSDENNPWSYIWIGIGGELIGSYLDYIGIRTDHFSFDVQNLSDFKAIIFECFAYEHDDLINEIVLQKQVYKFLELLVKSSAIHKRDINTKKMNPYVSQALEIIVKNAHENISVASISDQLSISPSYLSRLFKKDIGSSIKEYINEIRITIGCDLLASTDYSIQEISEMTGFSGSQAFSKAFKQSRGIQPTLYRKKRLGVGQIRPEKNNL
ncbi:AraC family transcriptional regulator [Amphibacillus sp. MSJ-3]|uniref:AraC family transcriptional regulator n=1 Tax=Amphibacillus sp. MSJ-3 TaxID=2841505 RepID=UPI001C0E9AE1|nr:AraC family transcriptional regulator [Amphibacillus sp. MSJ-3]MBU5593694.1 AraC family transcriptional regulator [Amphibacillus sp. MSJ-3]